MKFHNCKGFTLIEVMISVTILAVFIMVVLTLLVRSTDTYGQLMNETDALKQARYSLDTLSRDVRESIEIGWADVGDTDAMLIRSARVSDDAATNPVPNGFRIDAPPFNPLGTTYLPVQSSIVLIYVNTTDRGIQQLVRLQLYYEEDLDTFAGEYQLAAGAYSGENINILDAAGTTISINRASGAVNGTMPYKPPRIIMDRISAFNIEAAGYLYEVDVQCQYADRNGRTATSTLTTELMRRNIYGSLS